VNARGWLTVSLLATIGLPVSALQTKGQLLNVKLGLWEVTATSQSSGMPPIDLSQLPPETRAKAEAAMKEQFSGKPTTHTMRSCLTKEKLEKDLFQDEKDASCKRTTVTSTASVVEFTVECKGERTTTGHMRFEAVTPENVKGNISMKIAAPEGGKEMTVTSNMVAKWLNESCGDVK
jgi:uncharacterized protein DUF3617